MINLKEAQQLTQQALILKHIRLINIFKRIKDAASIGQDHITEYLTVNEDTLNHFIHHLSEQGFYTITSKTEINQSYTELYISWKDPDKDNNSFMLL
jgi:hypothetical protein